MKTSNILGLNCSELVSLAESLGEKPFRGRQLYTQVYRRKAGSFEEMTDLAKSFRGLLAESWSIRLPQVRARVRSGDGTVKFLLELEDAQCIEMVFIPEEGRDTLCISSQVGCDVGCTFCLTAQMGFRRNLRPAEIVGQVLQAIREGVLEERGFNIVFMGMGEPLYNYRNVMKAFRLLIDEEGMNLSYRKITVSTSGVVPVLNTMASEPVLPNLAVSLNATTDPIRDRLMPINRKWNLDKLIRALHRFPLEPRRRITVEYVLLEGENDSEDDARRLIRLLRGLPVKINLIPYNANPGLPHERPDERRMLRFQSVLGDAGLASFFRKTRGADVSAACGQLAFFSEQATGLEVENVR